MKTAVITGLAGMDGSHLADLLLESGYKVYGLIRRSSRGIDLGNANHQQNNPNLEVVEGDLLDPQSLERLCRLARPDYFYNMASQSHVGSSFEQPTYTTQCTGVGVLNCLEAIRLSGIHTRFLQASTSELYGGMSDKPAAEDTPFHPRSPYGCAKLYGYWITVNYREAYKMFACNSICFNHECFYSDTPVLIKKGKEINIVYVSSLVANRKNITHDSSALTKEYKGQGIEIWDGKTFVELKAVSRKKLSLLEEHNQYRLITNAPAGSIATTPNHRLINQYEEKLPATNFTIGTEIKLGEMPICIPTKACRPRIAKMLGILCGDGYIGKSVRLTNNSKQIRDEFVTLAKLNYCNVGYRTSEYVSGFGGTTTHTDLTGLSQAEVQVLREMLYDEKTGHKKVPQWILNTDQDTQLSFLKGYFLADGLKAGSETYEFSSFKTNSPLLAQGVLYLIAQTTRQTFNINTFEQRGKIYTQVNLHSPDNPHKFGEHLRKESSIVKKSQRFQEDNQHVFDIETASGKVMAGIGVMVVANSERRGPNFVTRKITQAVARIKYGLQDKLYLGNLDARRDWGAAEDFVKGMKLMLEAAEPDNYVLATGETHSVREFCHASFDYAGLDYRDYVEVDPKFFRPAEVDVLVGDYSKIKNKLGWEPTITFSHLAEKMTQHDLDLLNPEPIRGSL